MKYFPYKLSEQVLSVLPEEDRKLYNFEHSDYYNWPDKEKALAEYKAALEGVQTQYLNEMLENPEYENENIEDLQESAKAMAIIESEIIMDEIQEILRPIFTDGFLTEDEYTNIINTYKQQLNNENSGALNEATVGPDMTFWMKGLSLTLGPLFTGMAALLLAGKTAAAIDSLKKYMNRIVEMIDDGINKKRSFWAKLGDKIGLGKLKNKLFGGAKTISANIGDQENACFRQIQEQFESNIACKGMILMKNLGFFGNNNWSKALNDLQSNKFENGGINTFLENIATPVSKLANKI